MNQTPTAFLMRLLRPFRARNDIQGIFFTPRDDKCNLKCISLYHVTLEQRQLFIKNKLEPESLRRCPYF